MNHSSSGRAIARVLLALAAIGLVAHVAWALGLFRGLGIGWVFDDFVYNGVFVSAAAACTARAVLDGHQRLAWSMLAAGLALSAAGDIYWTVLWYAPGGVPYPSGADALYLAAYPCLYAGIGLLIRSRVLLTTSSWIDGAIGGLAAAAVATAVLGPALVGLSDGGAAATAVNVAYPIADVLLIASIVIGVIIGGDFRADRRLFVVGLGLVAWASADTIFLYQEATTGYVGGLIDDLWLIGAIAIAAAAQMREPAAAFRRHHRTIVLPAAFALVAIGVLAWGQLAGLPGASVWLALATLGTVVGRLALTFQENTALLSSLHSESLTDSLTGLSNRRALVADLSGELAHYRPRPVLFAIFDLDGFKAYNDAFGHPAGDLLLRRLGLALAESLPPEGRAYRLGGDEFCVLVRTDPSRFDHVLAASSAALGERGEGFEIGSSRGAVVLHEEVDNPSDALRVADARMYAEKGGRPTSPAHQTREVLVRIVREREPGLGEHLHGVASLAADVGRELGLPVEEQDVLVRAAELHDVGKIGIPDRILHKPGPLDEVEWALIRTHTLIGERILAAAPAMTPVAAVVRSTHERWDGNGYPDRLAGAEIPLAARIVSVCDAYDSMTADRPYREARSPGEAIAELHRCAGTQFDPEVVDTFVGTIGERLSWKAPPLGEPASG